MCNNNGLLCYSMTSYQPMEFWLSSNSFNRRMCKIVFHSLFKFSHITQWFLRVPNANVVDGAFVERGPWDADLAHPKILVWRPLWLSVLQTM